MGGVRIVDSHRDAGEIVAVVAAVQARNGTGDIGHRPDGLRERRLHHEAVGAGAVLVDPDVAAGAIDHIDEAVLARADSGDESAIHVGGGWPWRAAAMRAYAGGILVGV